MAEENINQSLEPRQEPLKADIHNANPEPEKKKAHFLILLVGIFLTIRGVIRLQAFDDGFPLAIVMIIIGLLSLYMFFKDRI